MKQLILSLFLITSFNTMAATKAKVTMPDSLTKAKKKLVLNGMGIRKATFFKIKVYVGGLYLEKKTKKYEEFAAPKSTKHITMQFVMGVSAKKLINGWNEAFNNAHNKKLEKIQKRIDKFNSFMVDMEKKDKIEITFLPDGVETTVKGKKMPKIKGADFSKSLLSVWFVNSIDDGLRKGLLGL